MKKSPIQAVKDGTTEVIGGVIASVLTTVAIFIPIINMQEEAGQLFRDIALASSSAVGLSLFVSLIVIPTLSYQVHKITPNLKIKPIPIFSKISQKMVDLGNLCVQWIMYFVQLSMQSTKNKILTITSLTCISIAFSYFYSPKWNTSHKAIKILFLALLIPHRGFLIMNAKKSAKKSLLVLAHTLLLMAIMEALLYLQLTICFI